MSKNLRVAHAALAGLQALTAGAALANAFGEKWVGLFVLVVAAGQAALVAYEQGLRTPVPSSE